MPPTSVVKTFSVQQGCQTDTQSLKFPISLTEENKKVGLLTQKQLCYLEHKLRKPQSNVRVCHCPLNMTKLHIHM